MCEICWQKGNRILEIEEGGHDDRSGVKRVSVSKRRLKEREEKKRGGKGLRGEYPH